MALFGSGMSCAKRHVHIAAQEKRRCMGHMHFVPAAQVPAWSHTPGAEHTQILQVLLLLSNARRCQHAVRACGQVLTKLAGEMWAAAAAAYKAGDVAEMEAHGGRLLQLLLDMDALLASVPCVPSVSDVSAVV